MCNDIYTYVKHFIHLTASFLNFSMLIGSFRSHSFLATGAAAARSQFLCCVSIYSRRILVPLLEALCLAFGILFVQHFCVVDGNPYYELLD